MTEVFGKNVFPEQCPVDEAAYPEGTVLGASATAGRCRKTTGIAMEALAVVAESITTSRDGSVRTVPAGYRIPVYPLASQETVFVRSVSGASYNPGDQIFLSATPGDVTNAHATSRPIGHFPRYGFAAITNAASGQLIPCKLDEDVGAALVNA